MTELQIDSCDILLVDIESNIQDHYASAIHSTRDSFNAVTCEGRDAALKYMKTEKVDLVVLDPFASKNCMDQPRLISSIKNIDPAIKVLVATNQYKEESIIESFRHGASGYILYQSGSSEFLRAITEVMLGGAPMSREVAHSLIASYRVSNPSPLTRREREVLREMGSGKSYKYIARELHVTVDTIRTHAQHIFEKLDVHNKSEAVMKGKQKKLI